MTRRLIESWLPIAALGEESVRERRSMTALPPTYYLHVWWARQPLVASRAAILASLLPEDADRAKFMRVLGIHGERIQLFTSVVGRLQPILSTLPARMAEAALAAGGERDRTRANLVDSIRSGIAESATAFDIDEAIDQAMDTEPLPPAPYDLADLARLLDDPPGSPAFPAGEPGAGECPAVTTLAELL